MFLSIFSRSLALVSTKPFLQYAAWGMPFLLHSATKFHSSFILNGQQRPKSHSGGTAPTCLERPADHLCADAVPPQAGDFRPHPATPAAAGDSGTPPRNQISAQPRALFPGSLCCGNVSGILNPQSCELSATWTKKVEKVSGMEFLKFLPKLPMYLINYNFL